MTVPDQKPTGPVTATTEVRWEGFRPSSWVDEQTGAGGFCLDTVAGLWHR